MFLSMRNKFVYSYSVKITYFGIPQTLGKHFLPSAGRGSVCLQHVVKMLKEGVVSWWEVRWIWQMRQNVAHFVQLLKCWLCGVRWGVVMENGALSVDRCQPQVLQVSVHLIGLLSILLKCNGFTGIQKAVWIRRAAEHQTVTMTFFGASLVLGSALELLLGPATELDICWLLYEIHFWLHITIWLRNSSLLLHRIREDGTSKRRFFFLIFSQRTRHPFIELFHLSNLLQMLNDYRTVGTEFFSNFSCSYKRIGFDECSQLVIVNF